MPRALCIPRDVLESLVALGRGRVETCGLALGTSERARATVERLAECRNVAADPARAFDAEPHELAAALLAARDAGLEVVATWHAHPDGDAVPSRADVAAADPAWPLLIAGARGDVRAWRVAADGRPEEMPVTVTHASGVPA